MSIVAVPFSELGKDYALTELDEFIIEVAEENPDDELYIDGRTYSLLRDGRTIISRWSKPSVQDRRALDGIAGAIVELYTHEKPLIFYRELDLIWCWESLKADSPAN